ncbi:cyclopropane-fatty-acyl-phospholipid synthase [Marichromatium purpuratum 984]|uniref:Cyclopropane-fatty-acyl-phospholipid synthase n=1 Tax=Marichromatium purpuratum 984 TaxID=765910 RepID=W0E1V1_MARPU|nr:cyclopropane-fatty-acyl-phospholipid synthase family protein [Marichromatium purpuratum]AHF03179.1 cyclopropane-fatty-acyl-phospholipid synthase [Marichromatium purpuratum 984]
MFSATATAIRWVEQGLVPDGVTRGGIRALLRQRLASLPWDDCEAALAQQRALIARMDDSAIAEVPQRANEQHYELPAAFFATVLGPRRKYSCCYWPEGVDRLERAEEVALAATLERADIRDGQRVLELGCGWGAFSLYLAERLPGCRITAVSNSHAQRRFIEAERDRLGLDGLEVVTADMNDFQPDGRYDRVVSLEMFEHMRNHRRLLGRIHDWLQPGGRMLMHIFCHRHHPYFFEDDGPSDWMTHYFFAGGLMPSDDLPLYFQDRLRLIDRWRWNGLHYAHTLEAWLARMDGARERVWPLLEQTYGTADAPLWWRRWRLFFMACAELFAFRDGQEWYVGHYLFERPA